jgi:hypothetical protein
MNLARIEHAQEEVRWNADRMERAFDLLRRKVGASTERIERNVERIRSPLEAIEGAGRGVRLTTVLAAAFVLGWTLGRNAGRVAPEERVEVPGGEERKAA